MREMELYREWLEKATEDAEVHDELIAIAEDEEGIQDRFYREPEFGTAGIRGVIGAGANRMNIYTIRKTTAGLAKTLNNKYKEPKVAISYDSRNKSELFAEEAAKVLAAAGIKSYIYPELMPTPCLSFAVRALECSSGIMITASHNPAKYNGFKCYGPDGCQMTDNAAAEVHRNIAEFDCFNIQTVDFERALSDGIIEYISDSVCEDYYANVMAQSIHPEAMKNADLHIIYTPLNGTGNKPVRTVLSRMGMKNISVVAEQENPDPNFTTCPFPNPEISEALALGLRDAKMSNAELLIATDPDSDRVGMAVRQDNGEYKLISGNEAGVLMFDYICRERIALGTMPQNPMSVKTIVSTKLIDAMARDYKVNIVDVLTGFKYIGEQIGYLEEKGEENRYIFGFEESYGYLAGTYARDKDAVVASMLIVEMAAFYHKNGSSLIKRLESLYKKYGCYLHTQSNFVCEGSSGMQKMAELMASLRQNPPAVIGELKVLRRADYSLRIWEDIVTGDSGELNLPKSDVLVYSLENNCEVIIRPSGTEPKIKAYYTSIAPEKAGAQAIEEKLKENFTKILGF